MKLRNILALLAILSLAACQQPDGAQSGNADELLKAQAEIARLEKENARLMAEKAKATKQKPVAKKAKAEIGAPMDNYDEADEAAADAVAAPSRKLCWQDYCPCEPGQDGKGMEASLCRNLKAGIHVDDDIMAAAAMARDARRQIREFERENPGF